MANAGTLVAHLFKLAVTLVCMRYIESSYKIFSNENDWAARAFQILLIHSILGVFTFGTSGSLVGKRMFRDIYDGLTNIIEIVPLALFATEISLRCHVNEILRQLLLITLGILPIVHEVIRKKKRARTLQLTNFVIGVQLFTIIVACLKRGNLSVTSFVAAYILDRYFLEDLCDRFDVPYIDLAQYSMSFVEVFALVTIQEL
ncbi:uncharacterized protein [Venturia canescens]|uniref:uncharacterized protein n=1 Tax=Venturia canescens TaxID=32260 RepID=UPI001C9C59DF|nr:uncharacterized protein LOC122415596 [Venturia canescens]